MFLLSFQLYIYIIICAYNHYIVISYTYIYTHFLYVFQICVFQIIVFCSRLVLVFDACGDCLGTSQFLELLGGYLIC